MVRVSPRLLFDLLSLFVYVVVMDGVLVSGSLGGAARTILGLPLLVFVPGYAVLACLFPRHQDGAASRAFAGVGDGALTTFERTSLSFGVSLALLPPLALAIEPFAAGFGPWTILGALNAFVIACLVAAAVRRFVLYGSGGFDGPRPVRFAWLHTRLTSGSRLDGALFAILVVVAVVATSTLAVGLVSPGDGESYTNLALLTEDDDGNLTTAGYPTNLTVGESVDLVVAVENHEDRQVEYTLVGELQRVDRTGDSLTVVEESEVVRRSRSVRDSGTWQADVSVDPTVTGSDLRLAFMVYVDESPDDGRVETAAEHVHVWVDVGR